MSKATQSAMFDEPDDGLVIIGVPRDAVVSQSHSAFRKIDGSVTTGKFVSLSWGDIMVMLPRALYEEVYAYVTQPDQESRATAVATLLAAGLSCSK